MKNTITPPAPQPKSAAWTNIELYEQRSKDWREKTSAARERLREKLEELALPLGVSHSWLVSVRELGTLFIELHVKSGNLGKDGKPAPYRVVLGEMPTCACEELDDEDLDAIADRLEYMAKTQDDRFFVRRYPSFFGAYKESDVAQVLAVSAQPFSERLKALREQKDLKAELALPAEPAPSPARRARMRM